MRVADKMAFDQVTRNLQKNRTELAELQNQAATQKRLTKPSDDPIAAARVLAARSEDRGLNQFQKNIQMARSFLEFSDQSLNELSESLVRLRELAIQQANDAGASSETRRAVAEEVSQLFAQSVQIGNRKLGDRYIFGGHQTTTPPFTKAGDYQGDDGNLQVLIGKDAFLSMNLPGDRVFLGRGLGPDGLTPPLAEPPRNSEEVRQMQKVESQRAVEKEEFKFEQDRVPLRGPASESKAQAKVLQTRTEEAVDGVNVLQSIKDLEIALRVNDKTEIQTAIDNLDAAHRQIVHSRAQVGARVQVLNSTLESLQKATVDNKTLASQMEDADLFDVVSEISKKDSALKATLETSGRLVQPSLLDFLK